MRRFKREEVLVRLQEKIARKQPIVACGAGCGLIAKAAQNAGIDFIYAASTAKLRADGMAAGLAALPYIDSNEITLKMASRLLPIMDETPVLAGIGAADAYKNVDVLIDKVRAAGFSGVTNIPTMGMYDDADRKELDGSGLGLDSELDMIRKCRAQSVFIMAFATSARDAAAMANAGADVIVAHCRHAGKGTLDDACADMKKIIDAAKKENAGVITMIRSCRFTTHDQVRHELIETGAAGFVGAEAIEKVPVIKALNEIYADMLKIRA